MAPQQPPASPTHPARAEGAGGPDCLLEMGVSTPDTPTRLSQERLGPDGGALCQRPVPCPSLCFQFQSGASTLWSLATPVGLLFVLRDGPQSTFPVVPRGERAGWFFPSLQNNGHSE